MSFLSYPDIEYPIKKSSNDQKEYKHISLSNGIRVLLISNKHDIKSTDLSKKPEDEVIKESSGSSSDEGSYESQASEEEIPETTDQQTNENVPNSLHDKSLKEKLMKTPGIAGFALHINSGCANEDKEIHGLAHLLEHVSIKA